MIRGGSRADFVSANKHPWPRYRPRFSICKNARRKQNFVGTCSALLHTRGRLSAEKDALKGLQEENVLPAGDNDSFHWK